MKFVSLLLIAVFGSSVLTRSQNTVPDNGPVLPVRGFCIAAPGSKDLDAFIKFIGEELAPRSVNTLILRVDFNYQYVSHPELSDSSALSKQEVQKLVDSL